MIAQRLAELGITLPPVFPPAGNYLGCVVQDDIVYVGGHGPVNGAEMVVGKVGGDLSLEDGQRAARMTALAGDLTSISDPPVRGVALVSFLVCDPMSPLYNSHSRVTVAEIAGRARAALSPG